MSKVIATKINIEDIRMTGNIIARDLEWTKAFYSLLFDVLAPLSRIKKLRIKYPTLFRYSGQAFDIAIIITLYKVYDRSNTSSLRKLLNQIEKLDAANCIQTEQSKYEEFIKTIPAYFSEIDSIKQEIGDLRNKYRAHNIEISKIKGKFIWKDVERWIKKAENILNETLCAIGEPAQGFIAKNDIEYEKKKLFNEIKNINYKNINVD